MAERINTFKDLRVYQLAMDAAMEVFLLSKRFPSDEKFSLTDQFRRSSRSVCANIAEAWRKRRYAAAFVAKLSDAEAEAAESQVWIEFCKRCGYLPESVCARLDDHFDHVLRQLVKMIDEHKKWLVKPVPFPVRRVADSPVRRFADSD
jgi:four helix bundle protein